MLQSKFKKKKQSVSIQSDQTNVNPPSNTNKDQNSNISPLQNEIQKEQLSEWNDHSSKMTKQEELQFFEEFSKKQAQVLKNENQSTLKSDKTAINQIPEAKTLKDKTNSSKEQQAVEKKLKELLGKQDDIDLDYLVKRISKRVQEGSNTYPITFKNTPYRLAIAGGDSSLPYAFLDSDFRLHFTDKPTISPDASKVGSYLLSRNADDAKSERLILAQKDDSSSSASASTNDISSKQKKPGTDSKPEDTEAEASLLQADKWLLQVNKSLNEAKKWLPQAGQVDHTGMSLADAEEHMKTAKAQRKNAAKHYEEVQRLHQDVKQKSSGEDGWDEVMKRWDEVVKLSNATSIHWNKADKHWHDIHRSKTESEADEWLHQLNQSLDEAKKWHHQVDHTGMSLADAEEHLKTAKAQRKNVAKHYEEVLKLHQDVKQKSSGEDGWDEVMKRWDEVVKLAGKARGRWYKADKYWNEVYRSKTKERAHHKTSIETLDENTQKLWQDQGVKPSLLGVFDKKLHNYYERLGIDVIQNPGLVKIFAQDREFFDKQKSFNLDRFRQKYQQRTFRADPTTYTVQHIPSGESYSLSIATGNPYMNFAFLDPEKLQLHFIDEFPDSLDASKPLDILKKDWCLLGRGTVFEPDGVQLILSPNSEEQKDYNEVLANLSRLDLNKSRFFKTEQGQAWFAKHGHHWIEVYQFDQGKTGSYFSSLFEWYRHNPSKMSAGQEQLWKDHGINPSLLGVINKKAYNWYKDIGMDLKLFPRLVKILAQHHVLFERQKSFDFDRFHQKYEQSAHQEGPTTYSIQHIPSGKFYTLSIASGNPDMHFAFLDPEELQLHFTGNPITPPDGLKKDWCLLDYGGTPFSPDDAQLILGPMSDSALLEAVGKDTYESYKSSGVDLKQDPTLVKILAQERASKRKLLDRQKSFDFGRFHQKYAQRAIQAGPPTYTIRDTLSGESYTLPIASGNPYMCWAFLDPERLELHFTNNPQKSPGASKEDWCYLERDGVLEAKNLRLVLSPNSEENEDYFEVIGGSPDLTKSRFFQTKQGKEWYAKHGQEWLKWKEIKPVKEPEPVRETEESKKPETEIKREKTDKEQETDKWIYPSKSWYEADDRLRQANQSWKKADKWLHQTNYVSMNLKTAKAQREEAAKHYQEILKLYQDVEQKSSRDGRWNVAAKRWNQALNRSKEASDHWYKLEEFLRKIL